MSDLDTVVSLQHQLRLEEHDFSQSILHLRIITRNLYDELKRIEDTWREVPLEKRALQASAATMRLVSACKWSADNISRQAERVPSLRESLASRVEMEDA